MIRRFFCSFIFLVFLLGNLSLVTAEGNDGIMSEKLIRTKELLQEAKDRGNGSVASTEAEQPSESLLSRMLQGLMLCLGVFFIGTAVAKRFRKSPGGIGEKQMKILERLPLTAKSSLIYIEVNGCRYLVSCGSEQVSMVQESESVEMNHSEADQGLPVMTSLMEREVGCEAEEFKLSA